VNQPASQPVKSTHAPFSPSGFKRKSLCPASHIAERPFPNVSGTAAIDGTHTHTLVEQCILDKQPPSASIGATITDEEGSFVVDKDRADRANMAITYVNNQVIASAYPVFVTAEQSVDPGSLIFRDDWYGTADITMIFADTPEGEAFNAQQIQWINVIDYKDGAQPVDPYENYQGISYMLGVIAQYMPPMDTPIIFTIIQPKAGGIKEWQTTVGDLMGTWLPHCQEIIERSLATDAPFCAGEEQCHYCLNRNSCEARQSTAVEGINTALANVDMGTGAISPIASTLPSIGEMAPETLSEVMMLAPIIRGWLKDIDAEALERVKKGGIIPNYKLIQKTGRRSWNIDMPAITKSLLSMTANKERIFKKADIVEETLISFTKVLGNANLSATQKARIDKEFIKHPQGQKTLVLKTEKGKDISPATLLENMPDDITMQSGETSQ